MPPLSPAKSLALANQGRRERGWGKALLISALVIALPAPVLAQAAPVVQHGPSEAVFVGEIVLLLICGRLLGEAMQRIGQPAIMGQLLSGVLLGPSVLGTIWPAAQHALFPTAPEQKAMIDAVSQLGILMLLLLTGMETDLALVRRTGKAAFSVSVAGIAVPFMCGILLGEVLPDSLLPHPDRRLVTTLFIGTALAIASVKIVALTIREMDFLRRTIGQLIVTAAIIDDTIGWILLSIILGLASHGAIDLASIGQSVVGTLLFLAVSFTIGRRAVALVIRWANDYFVSDLMVITAILVVMGIMALITNAIGVHTVLGAFVAGILVGQSPILTRHIDEQLRGLIVGLFMPVFFGVAGLQANLAVLGDPSIGLLAVVFILIASLGKFSGAFLGGRIGGLNWRECLALGWGMNARGSTEVVVATIGLGMGALSESLFTIILVMAVVTTMAMPPMLRWALARVPLRPDEEARLEREAFEAQGFVTNIERLLVAVDDSPTGNFASRLAGLLAGSRRIPTTILESAGKSGARKRRKAEAVARATADIAETDTTEPHAPPAPVDITTRPRRDEVVEEAVAREARKGYDFLFIGVEPVAAAEEFDEKVTRIAAEFDGPFAIAVARGRRRRSGVGRGLDILVPVNGTAYSRHGAEVALALARADNGSVTVLYVGVPTRSWPGRLTSPWPSGADAILREVVEMGDRIGVPVRTAIRRTTSPEEAILRRLNSGSHNLIVTGVSRRAGDTLSFGHVAATILGRAERSIVFVSS
ncbi:MAG: cation:proton antiporter [Alphaproteobacteria bacterium]|nr:cation:proton antiporter [Alphaproteobacteria bacterium]